MLEVIKYLLFYLQTNIYIISMLFMVNYQQIEQ